ncbi:hypothetical protein AVEN_75896-1 [Araneus ventricosus]|uniref:Uncharacterized protein n=1 Tax=Araneus ventricosus TaxID=182803 RepID=A0A4Y2FRH0_ARAVE|nr:hypothetical protein AVEN_75896-1 [Araneus ventricosus]
MALRTLISMLLYIAMLIVCQLFKYSFYIIPRRSHQIQRSTLSVRAHLATDPADSPSADHLIYGLYCCITPTFRNRSELCPEFSLSFDLRAEADRPIFSCACLPAVNS